MSTFISAVRALLGLFVDDGALALAILAVVALAAVLALLLPGAPLAAGAALLFGCLAVLFANTLKAAS